MRLAVLALIAGCVTIVVADTTTDAVLQRERALWTAYRAGQRLSPFFHPTFVAVLPNGRVLDPGTHRTVVEGAKPLPSYRVEEPPTVLSYGRAVLVYGTEHDGRDDIRYMRVWVNERADRWVVAAYHGALVSTGPRVSVPGMPSAGRTPSYPTGTGDEGEVLAAHKALNVSWAQRDVTAYIAFTAPEFIRFDSRGVPLSREPFVARFATGTEVKRVLALSEDIRVRVFGDMAVLTAKHTDFLADGSLGSPGAMTRVFVKKASAWQQVQQWGNPVLVEQR